MKKTDLKNNGDCDIEVLVRVLLDRWEGNNRICYLTRNPSGLSEGMVRCRNFSSAHVNLSFWILAFSHAKIIS